MIEDAPTFNNPNAVVDATDKNERSRRMRAAVISAVVRSVVEPPLASSLLLRGSSEYPKVEEEPRPIDS